MGAGGKKFSRKQPHVDRIARALLDAEVFGDKRAAEKHGVHYNTIKNWRGDEPTPAIREAMERLRAEVASGWIDEGRLLRRKLIDRIASVAADTEDLDALINALRRTIVTAPTGRQVEEVIWREVKALHARAAPRGSRRPTSAAEVLRLAVEVQRQRRDGAQARVTATVEACTAWGVEAMGAALDAWRGTADREAA